jgi:hypothetical protein
VIEDVSMSRGIRLLSINHNGIILGSEAGFFDEVCDGVLVLLEMEMGGIYVFRA